MSDFADDDLQTEARGRQRFREEEPLAVACDFGVIYSLYLRPGKKGGARVILKVTWDDAAEADGQRSAAFEIDLARERLIALGRKNHALPAERFDSAWLCEWAKKRIADFGLQIAD